MVPGRELRITGVGVRMDVDANSKGRSGLFAYQATARRSRPASGEKEKAAPDVLVDATHGSETVRKR